MYAGFVGIAIFIATIAYANKTKNKLLVVAAVACLTGYFYLLAGSRTISVVGNQVRVENKFGGYATFERSSPMLGQVYMVIGPLMKPWGFSGYSTKVPAIPMGNVEELNRQFGDFRKCSAGAGQAALAAMVELRLIGANQDTLNQIDEAFINSTKTSQNVFIKFDGELLNLTKDNMQGRVRDNNPVMKTNVLISSLEHFSTPVAK